MDFDALLPLVTKLALVVVGAAAFQWLQGYCVNRLSYETVRDMRVERATSSAACRSALSTAMLTATS